MNSFCGFSTSLFLDSVSCFVISASFFADSIALCFASSFFFIGRSFLGICFDGCEFSLSVGLHRFFFGFHSFSVGFQSFSCGIGGFFVRLDSLCGILFFLLCNFFFVLCSSAAALPRPPRGPNHANQATSGMTENTKNRKKFTKMHPCCAFKFWEQQINNQYTTKGADYTYAYINKCHANIVQTHMLPSIVNTVQTPHTDTHTHIYIHIFWGLFNAFKKCT